MLIQYIPIDPILCSNSTLLKCQLLILFFTGGSMTYSPSHLFGQPLLIGLPRNSLTYETLYDRVLASLSRYVSPPEEGQEWWKNANSEAVNGSDDR